MIAFELLSGGKMPYELKDKALHEAVSVICEHEPTRLSSIDRALRGDVETIVGKALEKDRTRRYRTAGELAEDFRRYLDYEPITARRRGTWYQLRKFAARNKVLVTSVASIMLVLAASTVISTVFAARARRSAITAGKVSNSLQQMLASANPDTARGSDYTVRQMLDDFAPALRDGLADEPETEAAVQTTIGRAYERLRAGDMGRQNFERALELRRRVYGDGAAEVADSLVDLAWSLLEQKKPAEAYAPVREALDIYRSRRVEGAAHVRAAWTLQEALLRDGRSADAVLAGEEALTIARRSPQGVLPADTANVLHTTAVATFRAFEMYVILDLPPQDVSERLGLHIDNVYRSKESVTRILREKLNAISASEA